MYINRHTMPFTFVNRTADIYVFALSKLREREQNLSAVRYTFLNGILYKYTSLSGRFAPLIPDFCCIPRNTCVCIFLTKKVRTHTQHTS